MRKGRGARAGVACAFAIAALTGATTQASAQTQDYGGFRNVLAVGQGQTANLPDLVQYEATGEPPASFNNQRAQYTGLVAASPALTAPQLDDFYKPESFGLSAADTVSTATPKGGVRIARDKFNVPHVFGDTRADTEWGAGYASAQDRLFLMDVLRHTGRATLTELIGPGTNDSTVKMDAEQIKVADYTEAELAGMIDDAQARAGAEGAQVRADLDAYVAGVNAYITEARLDPTKLPAEYVALGKAPEDWKPTDTVAVASLIGGIFGKGGGSESLAAQALREAQKRFGANARPVFDDFRRIDDPEAPTTITDRFPFPSSGKPDPSAVALVDPGSLNTAPKIDQSSGPAAPSASATLPKLPSAQAQAAREADGWVRSLQDNGLGIHQRQSNALLIDAAHSTSGHPIAVMGPQVGYYSPEILTELDLHGGGIDARGAAFPGISLYILLGRGADFAWSATTATTDNVDQFVEKLCEPDGSTPTLQSDHYLYKGKCIAFENRDKVLHTTPNPTDPTTPPQTFTIHARRSVHGPVQGTATVDGAPVAIANARSTYFHELDSALPFKRLNDGEVHDAKSFQDAMGKLNFLFNWFYADDRDIAYLQSGWFPLRAKGTDPSLPTWGTGQWDWQGFDPNTFDSARAGVDALPKAIDPKRGYLVSWNNKQAPGWRAADDVWSYGPVQRVQLLQRGMEAAIAGGAKTDLTHLTQIMEEGATGDLRGKEAYPWIRRVIGDGGDPEVSSLLGLLDGWQAGGAHRRDANGDGSYDESPAVALMDAWWPRLVSGVYTPELGTPLVDSIRKLVAFDSPPNPGGSSYFDGWWGYIQKDLRSMLGEPVRGGFSRRYCGGGDLATCRTELISTLKEAAAAVNARYGSVEAAKVPATCQQGQSPPACDQIEFVTAGAIGTKPIPWQNRPTFQQIVEVQGHRPR